MMSRLRAPTAIRIPISRVRSVTETNMIFMIPIPPTSRETEAMLPKSTAITVALLDAASAMSDKFLIMKSSSAPGRILCRCRSSDVI